MSSNMRGKYDSKQQKGCPRSLNATGAGEEPNTGSTPMQGVAQTEIPEWMLKFENLSLNSKDYARSKYHETGERHNTKETRRRRIRRRINRMRKRFPNGANEDGSEDTPDEEEEESDLESDDEDEEENTPFLDEETVKKLEAQVPKEGDAFHLDKQLKEMLTQLDNLFKEEADLDSKVMQTALSCTENIIIFAYQIMTATSMTQAMMAFLAYIKMHTDKSVTLELIRVINDLSSASKEDKKKDDKKKKPDVGGEDFDFDELEDTGVTTQTVMDKWEMVKNHTALSKIGLLITAAMSTSMCTIKKIEWSPLGFKLVALEAQKEQMQATDVIDAAIKTFHWLCSTGYRVFEEKSLAPIMYSNQRSRVFNDLCDKVFAYTPSVCNGNSQISLQDFEEIVNKALGMCIELKKVKTEGPAAMWLQNKYSKLVECKQKVQAARRGSTLKDFPLGIAVTGSSGVGKSALVVLLEKVAAAAMDIEYKPEQVAVIDLFDKHQNTYRSNTVIARLDDTGHTQPGSDTIHLAGLILKFWNTVAAMAVKAELNDKGTTYIEFKIGSVTSNFPDLGVGQWTSQPAPCLNRFLFFRPVVKPEYRVPGGLSLDKSKITDVGVQDIWSIDVEVIETFKSADGVTDAYRFKYYEYPDQFTPNQRNVACKVDLAEACYIMSYYAKQHVKHQKRARENVDFLNTTSVCKDCWVVQPLCRCKNRNSGASFTTDDSAGLPPPTAAIERNPRAKRPRKVETSDSEVSSLSTPESLIDSIKERKNSAKRGVDPFGNISKLQQKPQQRNQNRNRRVPNGGFDDMIASAFEKSIEKYLSKWFAPAQTFGWLLGYQPIQKLATRQLAKELERTMSWGTPYVLSMIPTWMLRFPVVDRLLVWYRNICMLFDWSAWSRRSVFWGLYCTIAFSCLGMFHLAFYSAIFFFSCWMLVKAFVYHRHNQIQAEYLERRDALPESVKRIRDSKGTALILTGVIVGLSLRILKAWNDKRNPVVEKPEVQEKKKSPERHPDGTSNANGWMGKIFGLAGLEITRTNTSWKAGTGHILSKIPNVLVSVNFESETGHKTYCNGLVVRKGTLIYPRHSWHSDKNIGNPDSMYKELKLSIRRHDGNGNLIVARVSPSTTYFSPDSDWCMSYVPQSHDVAANTLEWFPLSYGEGKGLARLLVRDKNGALQTEKVEVTFGQTGHMYGQFQGGDYHTKMDTKGACMGIIASESKNTIFGVHIASEAPGFFSDQYSCSMMTLLKTDIEKAIDELSKKPGVHLSAIGGDIPQYQYGKPIIVGKAHPKNYAERQGSDSSIEVLGSTQVRAQFKSRVVESPLSKAVAEVCNVPNKWGKPQMIPNYEAFNATLDHIVNPSKPFPPDLVKRAVDDWLGPLEERIKVYDGVLRPLTDKESVLGIPGDRFINPLEMSTSSGFPIFGKKRHRFTDVFENGVLVDRVPDDSIVEEVNRLVTCWKNGVRAYPVVAATLKDEPTPVDSEKVRVFQNAPVALSLCIRKWFLSLVSFLGHHPVESESAVGVNAIGPEWQDLMDYVETFGEDNILAWDYSKYDVRMNSQVTTAAWFALIRLAEVAGYPAEDLQIMRYMVADIVHPLIDYNGTMVMAFGLNTSGHSLTVQINGIAGSIYLRVGFYTLYPDKKFKEYVAPLTYGDDMKGSRSPEVPNFNAVTFRDVMAEYGIKITSPDKKSELKPVVHTNDVDFLKRKSVYIKELDRKLGALDEDSIFKSLHANLLSKSVSQEEVAASCITCALHEWFAHGREVYEKRAAQMREVCEKVGIPLGIVHTSFDQRVEHWKANYLSV